MLNPPLVSTSEHTDKTLCLMCSTKTLKFRFIKQMQQDAGGKLSIQEKNIWVSNPSISSKFFLLFRKKLEKVF